MPKIPLLRDYRKKRNNTDNRLFRQSVYLDKRWKQLRLQYFTEHPLCENCLENGIIRAGEDIHHLLSPFKFKDDPALLERYAFDINNLKTLCKECHAKEHNGTLRTDN